MSVLNEFFEQNRVILFSVYGQVFFVMGLAVLFQPRRYSRLALARSIWLLGVFGLLHGLSEWAYVFIPVQAEYLPRGVVVFLWLGHISVVALSFGCLLQFGVEMLQPVAGARWLRLVPIAALLTWTVVFAVSEALPPFESGDLVGAGPFTEGDIWARYLLALPGASLAGLGLLKQVGIAEGMGLPQIATFLRLAAVGLFAYAIVAGLIVPPGWFYPSLVLNNASARDFLGIPVQVLRSLCGLLIAYATVRALAVFDVEMDRLIEQMGREHAIALERERIGRELHDGTIQTIYAAGLAVEDLDHTIGRDDSLAHEKAGQVMGTLNRAIAEIRDYVTEQIPTLQNREFEARLSSLARDFARTTGITADFAVTAEKRLPISAEGSYGLLQVAREAVANVAQHAQATRVVIGLAYERDVVVLEVVDDGKGFVVDGQARSGQPGRGMGLRNISRRLGLLGGTVCVNSSRGNGTSIRAEVPYGVGGRGQA